MRAKVHKGLETSMEVIVHAFPLRSFASLRLCGENYRSTIKPAVSLESYTHLTLILLLSQRPGTHRKGARTQRAAKNTLHLKPGDF
jgi:hypothetical protein